MPLISYEGVSSVLSLYRPIHHCSLLSVHGWAIYPVDHSFVSFSKCQCKGANGDIDMFFFFSLHQTDLSTQQNIFLTIPTTSVKGTTPLSIFKNSLSFHFSHLFSTSRITLR